ncbi:hypothetical protein VOLCADRAFT_105243 [Volvox carteri f. nagariensis]|uniref:Transcription factor CBF/NF-Y/archaeal histone domain-containing protein n=1 Tax=Volvox carteri f. nagariensis TaxID=3068 RepID=D8TZI6_VOLCA|nr:uncharacterized protein VOLCADRAFT_105243 [Volvox carteri f. nagariensis]EFJ47188.1 hypothetical protein VOLCADRAFT_105243 [Volvox carteri f. nagariensis]|eukprot:XP_002951737.1 hypothetical protein VOLCADRAFT_105243 [Volvox carteri f. nagariensis]
MDTSATEKPETDVDVPRALIKRIVKAKLSALAEDESKDFGISKDALTALSESTKVFISLIASTANDICQEKRRSTVNADDVFNALQDLDFSELVAPLKEQLEAFKEAVKERNKNRPSKKRKNTVDAQVAVPRNLKQQQYMAQHQNQHAAVAAAPADADADAVGGVGEVLDGGHGSVVDAGGEPDELQHDAAALDADVTADVLGGPADDDGLGGLGMGMGLGLVDSDPTCLGDPSDVGVEVEDMLVDAPP